MTYSGGLPLIIDFPALSHLKTVSLPREEPSSSSTQEYFLSPCASFPCMNFPSHLRIGAHPRRKSTRFPRGCYLTKQSSFLQATLSLLKGRFFDLITLSDGINHILTLGDLSKYGMFTIQMGLGKMGDKELGAIGVGSGIGHGDDFAFMF